MKHLLLIFFAFCIVTGVHGQAPKSISHYPDTLDFFTVPKKPVQLTVRKIELSGNEVSRRKVLLRELSIEEGDVISTDSLNYFVEECKLRLTNLTIFNEVEIKVVRIDEGEMDWYIYVKERFYVFPQITFQLADRNFNVWWYEQNHNLNRINLGLTGVDKNISGNLDVLSATVQAGYTQKLAISYTKPYVDKAQKNGLGISLSYSRNHQIFFATDSNKLQYVGNYTGPYMLTQFEGAVSYIYRPGYATRHILQLSYKDYSVNDTVPKLNHDYYLNGSRQLKLLELLYRFEYNHVDNWNYPLVGEKVVAYALSRVGIEGFKFQNYLNVEVGYFRNPLRKWYTSVIFRGRVMAPENQPYAFEGGLGTSMDYIRGYEYYVINGGNYGVLRLDLKRELINFKLKEIPVKYFTTLPLRVYPKIFTDIAYVRTGVPGNAYLGNRLLYSIGAGLDIITFYEIKIRLELAYNQLGQNGLYLHSGSE
ncbi:MAG: POTRA domain-containing protein [Flavipsychrobacter sp.]|nr:POTRA domain-containing protein [Flavipsychrobacter sp.]